jgi:aspartate aminotransferase
MKLARRVQAIKPSPTLALGAKAKALVAKGVDVVSFAAGEPDFDTPTFVKDAAVEAIRAGFTKYTATGGIPELKAAIVEKLARENGLQYSPEQVLVSVGAKHSLFNFFQATIEEGDEVLIFSPYWVSYPDMVKLAGGIPVVIDTREEDGFVPDPQQLARALNPKVRAVVLNSPSNPTGSILPKQALRRIADLLAGHECLIVTDDIYEKLLFGKEPFANIVNVAPSLKDRTIVVNGVSKAYSMTGWRIGYAAARKELIAAMQMIQDQSTSNPTSIAQKAAVAALNGPQDEIVKMVEEFRVRRDLLVAGLNAIPGVRCPVPDGAFYAFPNVSGLLGRKYGPAEVGTSTRLSEILLEDFQLAAVPGQPFGAEGYLRLSFATSRTAIEKGLDRLRQLVARLG